MCEVVAAPLLGTSVQVDQLVPPSVLSRNWYLLIAVLPGLVQLRVTWPSAAAACRPVGAGGPVLA